MDVFVKDLERDGAGLEYCLSVPAPVDYPTFTFFASNSGKGSTSAHYINSIKFYDLDNPIYKGEQEQHHKFSAAGRDILHTSNQNKILAEDEKLGMGAYN